METTVVVLMILICFNFLLKQTFQSVKIILFWSIVASSFLLLTWEYATEQSKTQISDWLANSRLMLDTAVILTIEVLIEISYCIFKAKSMTIGLHTKREKMIHRILHAYPGLLFFPIIFSCLVLVLFSFPGISFHTVSVYFSLFSFFFIPLSVFLLKRLLPEEELRLEIIFLTNAVVAILGVITTVNGRTTVNGTFGIDYYALSGSIGIAFFFILIGVLHHRIVKTKTSLSLK